MIQPVINLLHLIAKSNDTDYHKELIMHATRREGTTRHQ